MPGLDEARQFIPLKIAVLTVSDTRALAEDKSGATLAERIEKAGHAVAERAIVTDDVEKIRAQVKGVDRRSGDRRHHHHRRHRLHRPRCHAGGDRAAVREAHGRLRHPVPDGEPRQDRHLGDPDARDRGRRGRDLTSSACRARPAPAATPGTTSSCTSSTTATGPAISSRSCRGWTSTCGARRHERDPESVKRFSDKITLN